VMGTARSMGFEVVDGRDSEVLAPFEASPGAVAPPARK